MKHEQQPLHSKILPTRILMKLKGISIQKYYPNEKATLSTTQKSKNSNQALMTLSKAMSLQRMMCPLKAIKKINNFLNFFIIFFLI